MKILITGGGGFLGFRLAQALLKRGTLANAEGKQDADHADHVARHRLPAQDRCAAQMRERRLHRRGAARRRHGGDTDSVFIWRRSSAAAPKPISTSAIKVNLDGTRGLLEACRKQARPPRYVFASSVAAFGGDLPQVLDDSTTPNPQTSYGAHKVCCEYLATDFNRKGFIDGRSLRLPTILVRAGKPNLAASSFASGIIREPLNGEISACPVGPETGVWLLSPGKVVDAFIHAHDLPSSAWGVNRVVNLPGITASVAQMVEALRKIAGDKVAALVEWKPDARIQAIVHTWPVRFTTERALKLGFVADKDVETVIRDYIRDQGIKM